MWGINVILDEVVIAELILTRRPIFGDADF